MNNFLFLAAILLPFNNIAQVDNEFGICRFKVDEKEHYLASGGKPGAGMEFYSEVWGGKLIKTSQLDDKGELQVCDNNFSPAFILDKSTDKVHFIAPPEFELKNVILMKEEGLHEISWDALVDANENIVFEVWKSLSNKDFQLLCSVPGTGSVKQHYYIDAGESAGAVYKIQVVNIPKGIRYTSFLAGTGISGNVKVYPSVVSNTISVRLGQYSDDAQYKVSNALGQIMLAGKLSFPETQLDLSNLAAGSYFITVNGATLYYSSKIIKE